jgi:hypothetical protein
MKSLKTKLAGLLVITFTISAVILHKGKENLESDKFSSKLFDEKQSSLILGTSKAEKLPVRPINSILKKHNTQHSNFYNYAFHLGASPYGPLYYEKVMSFVKSNPDSINAFILCVDPWALSCKKNKDSAQYFGERTTYMSFDLNSSFPKERYFHKYYTQSYITLFMDKKDISKTSVRPDSLLVKKQTQAKMYSYKNEHLFSSQISTIRYSYFEKLIESLKNYGTVYLVILPTSKEMVTLESKYCPDFTIRINSTAKKHNLGLIDFTPVTSNYLCPDGNHLFSSDAAKVSSVIADIIILNEPGNNNNNNTNLLLNYLKIENN